MTFEKTFFAVIVTIVITVICDGAPVSQNKTLQSTEVYKIPMKGFLKLKDMDIHPGHFDPGELKLLEKVNALKDKGDLGHPKSEKSSPKTAAIDIALEKTDNEKPFIKSEEPLNEELYPKTGKISPEVVNIEKQGSLIKKVERVSLVDFLTGRLKTLLEKGTAQELDVFLRVIHELSKNGVPFGAADEVEFDEEVYCMTQACVDYMKQYRASAQKNGAETIMGRWG